MTSSQAWGAFDEVARKRHRVSTIGSLVFVVPASAFLGLAGALFTEGWLPALFIGLWAGTMTAAFAIGPKVVAAWNAKHHPFP